MRLTKRFALLLLLCSIISLAQQPSPIHNPLPRATPESQGISSTSILNFIEEADKIDAMNSFMIVRHGKVVAEGWWAPYNAQTPHVLYSLSKSFTSTGVGLAISEGKLSLTDEVIKFFPDEAPANPSDNLKSMRVHDLLRMSTGHQTEPNVWHPEAGPTGKPGDTWTKTFLNHDLPFKPGTHFLYNSPGTYMLSAMVQKATGTTLLDYLKPRLFEPLSFDDPYWLTSPQGITAGAYGLLARTEDIARFGQLYLQKGKWNGKQLIPAEWVAQATKIQTSNGSSPGSDWDQGYGYQFWRSRHNTYRGDGAFGQYCMILDEHDTVIAITSGVKDMQHTMNLVWDILLPALKSKPLPENSPANNALRSRLSTLKVPVVSGQPTSSLATKISGSWYDFPENDRGIRAAALEFNSKSSVLLIRAANGETRTPVGIGIWSTGGTFANGIETLLSVPEHPLIAASGAWTSDDTFTVKLVAYQTPTYSTLHFRFRDNQLVLDSEYNVSFGTTALPQLIGEHK
jgi:CubicO group peptidase (beta-lactamase class C family)